MSTPANASWPVRMAARSTLIRQDLHRLWRVEGPVGSAMTRMAVAVGQGNAGRELVPRVSPHEDENTDDTISPHERDARLAGVGRRYRMTLIPKRNPIYATWFAIWNALQAGALAGRGFNAMLGSEINARGAATGIPIGIARGTSVALQYMALGWFVSPMLLSITSVFNAFCGLLNAARNNRYFDTEMGCYRQADTLRLRKMFGTELDSQMRFTLLPFIADFRNAKREFNAFKTTPTGRIVDFLKDYTPGARRKHHKKKKRDATFKPGSGAKKVESEEQKGEKTAAEALGMRELLRSEGQDLYDVLQVPSTATQKEIKEQYGRLAKVYHPDKNPDPKARETFDDLTAAYKVLNDPKTREAYDMGGSASSSTAAAFAEASKASKGMRTAGRRRVCGGMAQVKDGKLIGAPHEVSQAMFGGLPFCDLLIGPIFRSPQHVNTMNNALISINDFERLQVMRMVRQIPVLAAILDAYAMEDLPLRALEAAVRLGIATDDVRAVLQEFEQHEETGTPQSRSAAREQQSSSSPASIKAAAKASAEAAAAKQQSGPLAGEPVVASYVSANYAARCDKFATRLSRCCFGNELLYEVGQSFLVGARRHLGVDWFFMPKYKAWRSTFNSYTRLGGAIKGTLSDGGLGQDTQYNVFALEFDSVFIDVHQVLRFVVMCVLNDAALPTIVDRELRRQVGLPAADDDDAAADGTTGGSKKSGSASRPLHVRGAAKQQRATSGKTASASSAAQGPRVEASEGFFVMLPSRLTRGSVSQQADVVRVAAEFIENLSDRDRRKLLGELEKESKRRRSLALRALGATFIAKGRQFGALDLNDCMHHFRTTVHSHENNSVPPVF